MPSRSASNGRADQQLAAMHRIAGIVDVEGDGRGRGREGAAEEIDQRRRHARHLKPRRRVLQTAHGGLRTQGATALRLPADGQLEQGIGAQGVAVVGIFVATRDREHAEAMEWTPPPHGIDLCQCGFVVEPP